MNCKENYALVLRPRWRRARFFFKLNCIETSDFKLQRITWCVVLLALIVLSAGRPQEFDDEDDSYNAGDRKGRYLPQSYSLFLAFLLRPDFPSDF